MKTTVILSSEVYGDEEFTYDTERELLEGVKRLLAESKKCIRRDGIEREIKIRIEDENPQELRFRAWLIEVERVPAT